MKANPERYIYPPRPNTAVPRTETEFLKNTTWTAQLKYNDTRTVIKYLPNGEIELWSRHAEKHRAYTCPDWLLQQLQQIKPKLGLTEGEYHLLDGGILDTKHKAIKDTIVLWDVLVHNGQHLIGTTYGERYNTHFAPNLNGPTWVFTHESYHKPYALGIALAPNVFFPVNNPSATWDGIWDDITTINKPWLNQGVGPLIEGLVFKDLQGKLKHGMKEQNNSHWIIRSRVATGRHAF